MAQLTRTKKMLMMISLVSSFIIGSYLYVTSFFYTRFGTKLFFNILGIAALFIAVKMFIVYLVVLGKQLPKVARVAISCKVIFLFCFSCAVFSLQAEDVGAVYLLMGLGITVYLIGFGYVVYRFIKDLFARDENKKGGNNV